jgi:hypothetical protein
MSEAIQANEREQLSIKLGNIDTLLTVKRERLREGNTVPDTFEYEGRVLDTDKAVERLIEIFSRDIDRLYDA